MEPKEQILARMYMVLTLLGLLPVLVGLQVLRLVVIDRADLRAQGERQANSFVTIPAMRGAILDREGRHLAVNTARYDVDPDPTARGFTQAVANTFFEKLSSLMGVPASTYRKKVSGRSSRQYVRLLRGITVEQKEQIEAWEVPGLILKPRFARRYNYKEAASHLIGHVGADGVGLAGLELWYDEELRGEVGRRAVRRDRMGSTKAYPGGKVVEPLDGENIVLTIDLVQQTILEEELARGVKEAGAQSGTAIAMDPYTGAILALANVPTYDPNRPQAYQTAARRNRAITDRMEPGSTFKLVAAVAAVEQGVVRLADAVETGAGWAVFGGRTMKDTRAYGTISFEEVIALSSNVGTAQTARRLDPGIYYQYARNLGFGQKTWVDLPGEVAGLLKKPRVWSGTTQTSMSIGYEVDVTPLQMLTAYAALANGGLLVRPYVVKERRDLTGQITWQVRQDSIRRAFKRRTAGALLPAFERVITEGTATRAQLNGVRVAGKTGTALKVSRKGYERGRSRASFAGFFPAEDPKVVMVVVVDEPKTSIYGGVVAAPIFQRISARWLNMIPSQQSPEQPRPQVMPQAVKVAALPEEKTGQMPDLSGQSVRKALFWLQAAGVEVAVRGDGAVVSSQSPAPGVALPRQAILHGR